MSTTEFHSITSTAAAKAAAEWRRIDEEERLARRTRKTRRAAHTRSLDRPRNGKVETLRVHRGVMEAALKAAGGDASRLRIVSETEVWVD
ncbi:hypothetical protein [Streptomyces sp. NPDC048489]|uniref:hypothetical protein n=1 Tax=Streptomyces sp. NPDC048489 TaxID=3154504 RepID=UPI003440B7F5